VAGSTALKRGTIVGQRVPGPDGRSRGRLGTDRRGRDRGEVEGA
jgi:hypothetical protein